MRSSKTAAVLATLSIPLLAGACVTAFGLDEYGDVAQALCACPGFENVDHCVDRAHERLSAESAEAKKAWLASFEARGCGTICDRAPECYADLFACAGKKAGCECCAFGDNQLACADSTCTTCRTCAQIVAGPSGDATPSCVTGQSKLRALSQCACGTACKAPCGGGFCQTDVLPTGAGDACLACIEKSCKAEKDACTSDGG